MSEKRKREITPEYIRTRFYRLYATWSAGTRQGVREALSAMDLVADEERKPEPQQPSLLADSCEAEEGEY